MNKIEESPKSRPMSPHLQIYRPTISMVMSVMHRLTGLALYVGVGFLLFWFASILLGQNFYLFFTKIMQSFIIQIVFFLFTWAFFHHMFGGIRHFIWDLGFGFDLKSVDILSSLTLILSFFSTILLFFYNLSN